MRFAHRADDAGPDHFAQAAGFFGGLALVAHLRGDFVLARRLGELARFPNRMGQRLLAIDMFAQLDRRHRGEGVQMIGRCRPPPRRCPSAPRASCGNPCAALAFGIFLEDAGRVRPIHVAQGDDILALDLLDVFAALATDADARDIELLARRRRPVQPEN